MAVFFFFWWWGGGGGGGLRPFQEYFTYIKPIVHQRWAKTGRPGKKNTWPSISRTWLSHMWPERGLNHSSEKPNGVRVSSLIPMAFAHMAVSSGPTPPLAWTKLFHLWSLYPISNCLGLVMVPDLWFYCHFACVQYDLLYILTPRPTQGQLYHQI